MWKIYLQKFCHATYLSTFYMNTDIVSINRKALIL
jgi:hypothetical protein